MSRRILLYQALALVPVAASPPPTTVTVLNPEVFAKPFPVGDQQFHAGPLVVVAAPPNTKNAGWHPQAPDVFCKPFPVGLHQFQAHAPAGVLAIVPPQGFKGAHDPLFSSPVPATLQQFQAWPVQIILPPPEPPPPPPPPPGAGKKKDYPSWIPQAPFDAETAKPKIVRPAWDRPEERAEQQPGFIAPAAPQPVPLPPASLFAGMPQLGPASLLAPTPPAGQPQGLPTFDHLVPPGTAQMGPQLRDAQDVSDALAVLKALGLLG